MKFHDIALRVCVVTIIIYTIALILNVISWIIQQ